VLDEFNDQHQGMTTWAPSFAVAGAYYDQAVRSGELAGGRQKSTARLIANAQKHADAGRTDAAVSVLLDAADALPDTGDLGELQQALRDLAASLG